MRPLTAMSFVLLSLLVAPAAAGRPDIGEPERKLARKIVAAFKAVDPATLAALVDFERRSDERLSFGTGTTAWADLDELGRMVEQHGTMKRWIDDGSGFNRYATLVDLDELADPDAGRGAVPDRRILRATTFSQIDGRERELLLVVTPDLRLLDIIQGAPYYPAANPEGEPGLLPKVRMKAEANRDIAWPDDVQRLERDGLYELRAKLLSLPDGGDRDLVIEQLHRNPRAAVAALLEELVALDEQPEPDAEAEALLSKVLTHIAGRRSKLRIAPELGVDVKTWRAANRRAVESWLRWHHENGLSFTPTDVEHPIDPTIAEKTGEPRPLPLSRWNEKLREQDSATLDRPAAGPAPSGQPPTPPLAPAPGGQPTAPAPPPPAARPAPLLASKQTKRDILFPAAADLSFRFGDREVTGRDVERKLPPSLRAALNDWAEPAARNGLRVIISGNPEAIVVGRAEEDLLRQCALWIDDTWSLLDGSIPRLEGRQRAATVALIMDQNAVRSDAWNALLSLLVEQRQLFSSDADAMRKDVRGLLRRSAPFFIQPTWDITGEGEFRLGNEVAHKFAQCLLTSRVGEQPPTILWGLGELAEIKLFGTVYQLNDTGFVASADHFDWPRRTRYWLDKHRKKHGFSLGELAMQSSQAGLPSDPQRATWAVLAWLQDKQPSTLGNVLLELADLQAAADPRRRATVYRGDHDATLALLRQRFDVLDTEEIIEWLDALD